MKADIILTLAMAAVTTFVGIMTFYFVEPRYEPAFGGVFVVGALLTALMAFHTIGQIIDHRKRSQQVPQPEQTRRTCATITIKHSSVTNAWTVRCDERLLCRTCDFQRAWNRYYDASETELRLSSEK